MPIELVDPMASVRSYLAAEKSDNTSRAYRADWNDFQAWCERASCPFLPAAPVDVARYLAQLADGGLKTATIQRRVAAIRSGLDAGVDPLKVIKQTRHMKVDTLKGYDRREKRFRRSRWEDFL